MDATRVGSLAGKYRVPEMAQKGAPLDVHTMVLPALTVLANSMP